MPRKHDNLRIADGCYDILGDISDEEISGKTAKEVRMRLKKSRSWGQHL